MAASGFPVFAVPSSRIMESHLDSTAAGKDGVYWACVRSPECWAQVPCLGTSGRAGATAPQSCEQLETGHPEVYQEDQKHSKYAEVKGGAKEESGRSRGLRPQRARQATPLGCRMTDGRLKTGHHWYPETRQGFTRAGGRTELQE